MRRTVICLPTVLITGVLLMHGCDRMPDSASEAPVSQEPSAGQDATATSVTPSPSAPSSSSTRVLEWADVIAAEVNPGVVTDAGVREAIKATGLPWRVRDKKTGIEMLLIPPGEFEMGRCSDDNGAPADAFYSDWELPAHRVKLTQAFYLGRYEVTQQQYAGVTKVNPSEVARFPSPSAAKPNAEVATDDEMAALQASTNDPAQFKETLKALGKRRQEADSKRKSKAESEARSWVAPQPAPDAKGKEWPVDQVSWDDCAAFCEYAGLRLPTEAEWEYACRAGTRTPRYGALDEIAWYVNNSGGVTHPVGYKRANALGLHDMLGNVSEWVNDWYAKYASGDAQTNPLGPTKGDYRVKRGGFWGSEGPSASDANLRASAREFAPPAFTLRGFGFRVARTP